MPLISRYVALIQMSIDQLASKLYQKDWQLKSHFFFIWNMISEQFSSLKILLAPSLFFCSRNWSQNICVLKRNRIHLVQFYLRNCVERPKWRIYHISKDNMIICQCERYMQNSLIDIISFSTKCTFHCADILYSLRFIVRCATFPWSDCALFAVFSVQCLCC